MPDLLCSRLNFDGDEHLTALQVVSELKPCSDGEEQAQEENKTPFEALFTGVVHSLIIV